MRFSWTRTFDLESSPKSTSKMDNNINRKSDISSTACNNKRFEIDIGPENVSVWSLLDNYQLYCGVVLILLNYDCEI